MRVPISWLKEYVDVDLPIPELAERLTLAGLDVETIEYIGLPGAELEWDPEKIVVGEIRAVRFHPDADRVVLAEVEYGGSETEVVVSGPPSLLPLRGQSDLHLKVAFAMEGAPLWDPYAEEPRIKKLKKSKIRGVVSPLQGKRRQLQPGDPAFGPLFQRRNVLCGQPQVHHLVEKSGRLVRCKAQVGGAQSGQLPTTTQARDG